MITHGQEASLADWKPFFEMETTDTKNIGFDFGFFNSKLTGTLNYYYNQTEDLLITKVLLLQQV